MGGAIIMPMRMINPKTGTTYFTKRRRRFDDEICPRELTFSCYHRFAFFSKDQSRRWFLEAVQTVRPRWPIDLWAWVIMPDHVHLLVAPREKTHVGRFAGQIKERIARKAIAWLEQNSLEWLARITVAEGKTIRRRFWQPGGGYDRSVESESTLRSMIDYIHANPVRKKLVGRPEDWEWSSARWYAGIKPVHLEMDETLPTFLE
jgi:putative transposase